MSRIEDDRFDQRGAVACACGEEVPFEADDRGAAVTVRRAADRCRCLLRIIPLNGPRWRRFRLPTIAITAFPLGTEHWRGSTDQKRRCLPRRASTHCRMRWWGRFRAFAGSRSPCGWRTSFQAFTARSAGLSFRSRRGSHGFAKRRRLARRTPQRTPKGRLLRCPRSDNDRPAGEWPPLGGRDRVARCRAGSQLERPA